MKDPNRPVSWSTLNAARVSMLHYRHWLTVEREDTAAMLLGRAVHTAVFEPHKFALDYVVAPDVDRRTKAGRESWAEFQASVDGKDVLTAEQNATAWEIGTAVRRSPVVRRYLDSGRPEVAIEWTDRETGLPCRGRVDWLTGAGVLCELKTARMITERPFASTAWRLGYFHQVALYSMGLESITGTPPPIKFIAVENVPPYDCGVLAPSEDSIYAAGEEVRSLLVKVNRARRLDEWPGQYTEEVELHAPRWAFDDGDNIDDLTFGGMNARESARSK